MSSLVSSHQVSLHFAWFASHATLTVTSILYLLSWLLIHPNNYLYRFSYLSAIVAYSISLYNTYKPTLKTCDVAIKRMLLDENSQYLLLAVYFLWTRRLTVSLVPFFIYSLFHVGEYVQNSLIPAVAPHASSIGDKLKAVIDQHYTQTMTLVANYELFVVMGQLILGLFVLQSSLFSILFYAHFIRMRYYTSLQCAMLSMVLPNKWTTTYFLLRLTQRSLQLCPNTIKPLEMSPRPSKNNESIKSSILYILV
ncbi:unnamed protein product [Absidia cylindrospora]